MSELSVPLPAVWLAAALFILLCIAVLVYHVRWLLHQARIAALVDRRVQEQLESWRGKDLAAVRSQEQRVARREAGAALQEWKSEQEALIRQDAVLRSRAVVAGKVSEHLAPYLPVFPYNPRDARFIGSPIDFIVFDGADDGEVEEIVFLEVKTGNSGLSSRQRRIRAAIEEGRVVWRELRLPGLD
jgi:predicted Holliday junction resolvase-like endonuclease